MTPLVGRDSELETIATALHQARGAAPSVVWVEGEAGVGKTSLVKEALDSLGSSHPDVVVWHCAGDAQEAVIENALSGQLLLASAPFAASPVGEDTPQAIAEQVLERIGNAAALCPVVLVVDDVHWCDHSSRSVLRFLMRRLRDQPVTIILTHRFMGQWPAEVRRSTGHLQTHTVGLGGLSVAGVREFTAAHGLPLTPRAGRRLHAHTSGNPQLVRALLEELPSSELTASEGPVRAPRSFSEWAAQVFASCEADVRAVVAGVAVLGAPMPLARLSMMTGVTAPAAAVDAAIDKRLLKLVIKGGERLIDVEHALVRSAVEEELSFHEHVRLHARAAELSQEPLRVMVHRLHACVHQDAALVEQALALAGEQVVAGAVFASARLLCLVGDLLPAGPRRRETWTKAAEQMLMVGELRWAENLLADIAAEYDGEPTAHELLVQGHLAVQLGKPDEARHAAMLTWERGLDPRVVVGAAELLAYLCMDVGDGDGAMGWATKAIEAADTRLAQLQWAGTVLISGAALCGDLQPGRDVLEQHCARLTATASEPDIRLGLALAALWSGDCLAAQAQLDRLQPLIGGRSTMGDSRIWPRTFA